MFHVVLVKLWLFSFVVLTAAIGFLGMSQGSKEKSEQDEL